MDRFDPLSLGRVLAEQDPLALVAVPEAHCRVLKLPTVRRQCPELVQHAAHKGWSYAELLLKLFESEVLVSCDGAVARLLRATRFPDLKTQDQLDWDVLRGI